MASYRAVLGLPGVAALTGVGFLARIPSAAAPITLTLHVVLTLGHGWAAAGLVGAAATIGMAIGAPLLGRLVDRPVRQLSLGERMRCEVVASLLHAPRLLFLDEPTLGLDPQSRNQLCTHVKHLNETEGVTVFLTTHYMDEAERTAHRIAVIDHGHIVAQGTAAALKQQTNADSLEGAFLALTGSTIRDERADAADQMRQMAKMWRR